MELSQTMSKADASAFLASDINFPTPLTQADMWKFNKYMVSVLNMSDHSKHKAFVIETNNKTPSFEAGSIISSELGKILGDSMYCYLEDREDYLQRSIHDFACTGEAAYAQGGIEGLAADDEYVMVTATIINSRYLDSDPYKVEKDRIDNEIKALNQQIIDALSIKYDTPAKMVAFLMKKLHQRPSAGREACEIMNQYLEASS